jgi:hypothetical protein
LINLIDNLKLFKPFLPQCLEHLQLVCIGFRSFTVSDLL